MAFKDQRLAFELDDQALQVRATPYAGVTLVAELFRVSETAAAVDKYVELKSRRRGLRASELVESLLLLWSVGGERCEDVELLRADEALSGLVGHAFPAPQTARDFLDRFHTEDLPLLQQGDSASVREESSGLKGLGRVVAHTLAYGQALSNATRATLDVDATILASSKREARMTFKGMTGYQPVVVLWAEQDLVVADEFRDGNVPAGSGNLRVVQRAMEQLPEAVSERYLRGDSALYEHDLMDWLDEQDVQFAISADMSRELRTAIAALDESEWHEERDEGDAVRAWAEVAFVPHDKRHRKNGPVRRYLAVRILKKQGALFADGSDRKHFAVVTNREGDGLELLRWHRQKAGTIEPAHHVLTNELAAEALPSKRFGANAAWFRLNTLLYNLLSLLRRTALPDDLQRARPKRLRFLCFNVLGQLVQHARERLLRLAARARALIDRARLALRGPPRPLLGD